MLELLGSTVLVLHMLSSFPQPAASGAHLEPYSTSWQNTGGCFRCALVLWWQLCHPSASPALVPTGAAPRGRQFPDIIVLQKLYYNYSIGAMLNIAILKWCSPVHEYRVLAVLPLSLPFCSSKKRLASSSILLCVIHYQVGLEKLPPGALTALGSRLAKKSCVCCVRMCVSRSLIQWSRYLAKFP